MRSRRSPSSNVNERLTATSIDISERLMNRETGHSTVARAGPFLFLDIVAVIAGFISQSDRYSRI